MLFQIMGQPLEYYIFLKKIFNHLQCFLMLFYQIGVTKRFTTSYVVTEVVLLHMDGRHITRVNYLLYILKVVFTHIVRT